MTEQYSSSAAMHRIHNTQMARGYIDTRRTGRIVDHKVTPML